MEYSTLKRTADRPHGLGQAARYKKLEQDVFVRTRGSLGHRTVKIPWQVSLAAWANKKTSAVLHPVDSASGED